LKIILRAVPLFALALSGCGEPPRADLAAAQHRYLAAKSHCDREFADSLALRADCRTQAANAYIRPYYRYGDLMDYAQNQRRVLAVRADQHEITRATYNRLVAESEREVSREEDRRNRLAHTRSSYESTPFTPVVATLSRLFN
jgi:hypothetical protein